MSVREDRQLPAAIDRAGSLVAQLRRRIQIEQRLDQISGCQQDLEAQSRRLLGRQLPSIWALAGLGTIFVLGVVLVMAGLFMPTAITGSLGWALAVLGAAGTIAAGLGKIMLERANSGRLDACQKQIGMVQLQVKQAADDRDALDAQLPHGGGPIAARLAAAQKDLASLEELLPLETRRAALGQEAAAAGQRAARPSTTSPRPGAAGARSCSRPACRAALLPSN